ncbi:MAG: CBS domain-containing protein [Thaumarchaeota archaeon]|nr:CBS domain-containing protein [Candidatus Calditenuaceae archaeon]MDW8187300.1 CBS domain-containing protein [Nitrososphaerota archaeon]
MPITVRVRDVMESPVPTIDAGATVAEAVKRMVAENVWSFLVTKKGLPVGVVTERDILRRCISKGHSLNTKIEEIMSSPIITIDPDEPIGRALQLMAEKNIRRLYVVEEGKVIGRITQTKSMESLLNVLLALQSLPYQF